MPDPAETRSLDEVVRASMGGLSNGERKVARALLAAYPAAGLTTANDLADAAGVSTPTVVRFAARLGYGGFAGLQKDLVREVNAQMGSPLKQYDADHDDRSVLPHAREVYRASLERSFDDVPASELDRLVAALADDSRLVQVFGGRFSRLVADYLVSHLQLLRPRVQAVHADDLSRLATAVDAGPSSLVIAYDYRRYDDRSVALARRLKDRGATVALMTDTWLSPIARFADVVLPVRVDSPSPFDSLVPSMALSETVVAALTTVLGESGRQRLEQIEGASQALR